MYIPIHKLEEDQATVLYEYRSDFWIRDPDRGRNTVFATYTGKVLVDKEAKECIVVEEMPHDRGVVAARALKVIRDCLGKGMFPDRLAWASG